MSVPELLGFWFAQATRARWFDATPAFDRALRKRWLATYQAALAGELDDWADSAAGTLALVIALDQFPRNMFRGDPRSFDAGARARALAGAAVAAGLDRELEAEQRAFLYLPLMHSEDLADQDLSVRLYREAGLAGHLKHAEQHREIVRRFGRFPHRNAILGRESTPEEVAWLASPDAFHG